MGKEVGGGREILRYAQDDTMEDLRMTMVRLRNNDKGGSEE